jgi:hypothetical protein
MKTIRAPHAGIDMLYDGPDVICFSPVPGVEAAGVHSPHTVGVLWVPPSIADEARLLQTRAAASTEGVGRLNITSVQQEKLWDIGLSSHAD